MENSSSPSFTNLLNSSIPTSDPQSQPPTQQHGFQQHFPINFPPHQSRPMPLPPHYYPQNFNLYVVQPGYPFSSSSYQHGIPYNRNFYGGDMVGPSSPVGSASMFAAGGSKGEGSASPESSPIAPAENANKGPIRDEDWSDAGSDEEKKGGRMFWSQEDNLRLISAWLNNSNDPIDGNSKKGPHFWKDVADEYNQYAPKGKKRTTVQCKNHWNTTNALVGRFHGCWVDISNTYQSGRSEQQLMEMVHEEYKKVKETEKPFPFEYWWRVVKDEPKWLIRDVASVIRNTRTKVSASGLYTSSSNQETEDGDQADRRRPQGQKKAKEQKRGKGKAAKGLLSDDNVGQFNFLQASKNQAIENMTAVAREHAQAIKKMVAADKERARTEKINKFTELMMIDISSYSES
ncbi:unnamed protein product [Urochloa decumbens]|uniref:Myb-like domain-containing protein n=1 Tax=Urochloa decumbens TaxID=240449 RepID=A0ABC8X5X8_9POAL